MGQTQSATHEKPLDSFAINLHSIRLTDPQFEQVCRDNPELRLELTAEGELIVMPPAGSKTGLRNSAINHQIRQWAIPKWAVCDLVACYGLLRLRKWTDFVTVIRNIS